jgi:hypothetical protein
MHCIDPCGETAIILREAAQLKIEHPVIVMLPSNSKPAALVLDAVEKEFRTPIQSHSDATKILMLGAQDVAKLLRRFCGAGGEYIADRVTRSASGIDYQVVALHADSIGFCRYCGDVEVVRHTTGYDDVCDRPIDKIVNDPGLSLVSHELPNGEKVPVCGATGQLALEAAVIVDHVTTRIVTVPMFGQLRTFHLTDDKLADLLFSLHNDKPKVIAEALRALRKLKGDGAEVLERILRRRKLRPLREAVRRELRGDAS